MKRQYRDFTKEELELITKNQEKISTVDLAKKLNINYSNLTAMLKQNKMIFIPFKNKKIVKRQDSPVMLKKFDEEGNALLTDDHYKDWFGNKDSL